jgi:hypothetical protein
MSSVFSMIFTGTTANECFYTLVFSFYQSDREKRRNKFRRTSKAVLRGHFVVAKPTMMPEVNHSTLGILCDRKQNTRKDVLFTTKFAKNTVSKLTLLHY